MFFWTCPPISELNIIIPPFYYKLNQHNLPAKTKEFESKKTYRNVNEQVYEEFKKKCKKTVKGIPSEVFAFQTIETHLHFISQGRELSSGYG